LLHGSLYDIKCFDCDVVIERNNYDDPFHPLLEITSPTDARLAPSATEAPEPKSAYQDPSITIDPSQLPHCPTCKTGLQRPGVVWFGEGLPEDTLDEIDDWVDEGPIDLMLVIGTTATV